jgi:hypothetical protein
MLTSGRRRASPGSRGGGCARHSAAAILLTDAPAPALSRGATASPGHRSGGVAGGGACAVAGPRRPEAREGLWTRSRRPRRGRAGDAWRGVVVAAAAAEAAAGPFALAGDPATSAGRRGRAMPAAVHHLRAGRGGGEASGIAVRIARAGWVAREI